MITSANKIKTGDQAYTYSWCESHYWFWENLAVSAGLLRMTQQFLMPQNHMCVVTFRARQVTNWTVWRQNAERDSCRVYAAGSEYTPVPPPRPQYPFGHFGLSISLILYKVQSTSHYFYSHNSYIYPPTWWGGWEYGTACKQGLVETRHDCTDICDQGSFPWFILP